MCYEVRHLKHHPSPLTPLRRANLLHPAHVAGLIGGDGCLQYSSRVDGTLFFSLSLRQKLGGDGSWLAELAATTLAQHAALAGGGAAAGAGVCTYNYPKLVRDNRSGERLLGCRGFACAAAAVGRLLIACCCC